MHIATTPSRTTPPPLATKQASNPAFGVLDTPQLWEEFSIESSRAKGVFESNIVVQGMHCAACAGTVERVLGQLDGVLNASVNGASARAKIEWDASKIKPSQWFSAIAAAGYTPVPARDTSKRDVRLAETRTALWRWLVAGLCMMQVMMYASPEYFARMDELTDEMRHLMRWASWVLTLPVILFSCKPFFINAWRDLTHRRVSMDLPVALGMLITFVVSSLGTFEPKGLFGQEVYFDSLTMFVFFLLTGRWLELRLRDKTAGALEGLINGMPDSVERKTQVGGFERVAVRLLKVNDLVRVAVGESFPADGVVIEGSTHADEALLTGESKAIAKKMDSSVIAGSHNLTSSVLVRVDCVGQGTRFAQMSALIESAAVDKPAIALLADRLAGPFLVVVMLIAGAAGAWWWSTSPSQALMVAVSILIVTCPCALSLATPAAMLAAAGALAKGGVLVRHLHAFESMAKLQHIVFDKTGTLTHDGLQLGPVHTRAGISREQAIYLAGLLAQHSVHPISRALITESDRGARAIEFDAYTVLETTEHGGQGVQAQLVSVGQNGEAARAYRLGSAQFCGVSALQTDAVQAHVSDSEGWLASFEFTETLRPDAIATVNQLKQFGLQVHIFSGDMPTAVGRVAQLLGVAHFSAQCTPESKLEKLKQLQANGAGAAMVGDGLNDGPVLAGATVSFAFGRAVPLTQSKADVLVLGERLSQIATTIAHANKTMRIVKQNLWWALLYNMVSIPLAIAGYMPAWVAGIGMAASSLLVVGNAMRLVARVDLQRNGA